MQRQKFVAAACVAGLFLGLAPHAAAVSDTPAARDEKLTLTVDGRARTATVHVPSKAPGSAGYPVVLAFHGRLGDGAGQERLTHLSDVADEKGFLVVYPDGYRRSWNDGRPDTPANRAGVNDVKFVQHLLDRIESRYRVDTRRIYATGMSNGGFLTQRLGCRLADRIAAIAPVAATLPTKLGSSCRPAKRMPMLMVMGTADPLVPYRGGNGLLSAPASAARWRALAGCTGTRSTKLPDRRNDGTRVAVVRGTGCRAAVKLYTVTGGGHTWPGGRQYLPAATVGRTSKDFDASRTIWSFFAGKRR
ncbi:PHB depolymerase family esterase [Sporichthya brevicatena]|uniref:PHB depolymerase family esterase n=1 Tax=Sporichthya brevicatena TaxID=171442 RepID=A0ABN1HD02_9ACTN